MDIKDDYLVPTTVLIPKNLKDRAKNVAPKHGDFSKMICDGLENEVKKQELLNLIPQTRLAS